MKHIYSLLIVVLLSSCGKFLDNYSQDLVIPKTVQDLNEVLLGDGYLPRKEVSDFRLGGLGWWTLLLDDDINTVTEATATRGSFDMDSYYYGYLTWQLEVGRSLDGLNLRDDSDVWGELYRRINAMNIILSEVDNMPQVDAKDKLAALRVKGESLFLRAQFYFTLVNLYGNIYEPQSATSSLGVPLKLTAYVEHDKDKESQFERASVQDVYMQIISDLELSADYLSQSPQTKSHRASKEAALLLLSRVHLYMQNWAQAAQAAKQVMESYEVLQNYGTVAETDVAIDEDNPEIILAQGPLNIQNMFKARGGDFCVTAELYDLFSDQDYRKDLFFAREAFTDSIAVRRKFKRGLHISGVSDLFLLRTSEAYLNLMEAQAMQAEQSQGQATLDAFRSYRYSNIPAPAASLSDLVAEIRQERRKELCLEGHRWYDLRRYGVTKEFAMQKQIIRAYAVYDYNDRNKAKHTEFYRLNAGDPAYLFSIPKTVLEFDRGMLNNPREARKSFLEEQYIN